MTIVEFLRAYPDDPAAIMSKRIVNEIADYIEELENDRIRISSTNDNSES